MNQPDAGLWEFRHLWGNFPQAYSPVGLVNSAYRIAKKRDRPQFVGW